MHPIFKIIIILLVTIATLGLSWWYYNAFESVDNKVASKLKPVIITGEAPFDFFNTIPKPKAVILAPPIFKPVVKLVKPKPKLGVGMFPVITRKQQPQPSAEDIFRDKILRDALYKENILEEVVSFSSPKVINGKPSYIEHIKSFDKDFSAQGISKETATYPVNLERVLTMNKHIPVVLYTEIHSEIPSQKVIAVVEQNVMGFHGRKVLIPRGSQAIGKFESLKSPDSKRLGIVWYRIITPDGINIKLTSEAVDQEGASGLTGIVDNRWKEKYGTALLFSSISALAQLSVPIENENAKAAADSFSAELGPIVAEHLRQSLDVVPRINIPKGSRLNISPLVDIWFKHAKGSEVKAFPLLGLGGR